ncbi:MAG: MMPL family transporter, partial [Gammaproteobacteria bacterium]|nr:MMPL family transporter [Gammaproteobacteria bacterium]
MISSDSRRFPCYKTVLVLICHYPRFIVAVVLVLFLLALLQIYNPYTAEFKVKVDPSEQALLGLDHEGWEFYQLARRNFGSDETIMVVIDADDVFSPQAIDLVSRLTNRLARVSGVEEVVSLTNALTIRATEYGMDIAPIMARVPETPEEYEVLRKEVLASPLIASTLISGGGDSTAILVNLEDTQDQKFFKQVNAAVDLIVKEEAHGTHIWITGSTRIKHATIEIVLDDLISYPPLITLVMLLLLLSLLRNLAGVLITLATVVISVVWTVATITLLGYSLNILTALVPPLLMILTLSYSMYLVSDYRLAVSRGKNGIAEIVDILRKASLPVLLAGLTTAVGFSSLYLSELNAIREFGLFAVIGVIYATIITLIFTPSLLVLLQRRLKTVVETQFEIKDNSFDRLIQRIAHFDAENRKAIFIIAGIVFVISIAGMTQLRVGTEHITNFKPDSDIRQAFEHANEKFNGINAFNIIVQSKYPTAFKEPVNLKAIEDLQQWLEAQPEIGGTTSLVNYIKFVNRSFNNNDPAFYIIPENKRVTGQLLFFTDSDDTRRLVDSSYRAMNIIVRAKVIDSDEVESLIVRVNERLQQLPEHMDARATGSPVLMNQAIQDIMWGQVESVFLSLIIVYGILVSLFLSFRIGLIALIPNILPVVVYLGALGILGISLNPSTSLIAPMILGVAIDDTIHYFTRFNSIARQHPDPKEATVMTLGIVGRPVTYTSLALCVGFLVLTTSDLRMQVQVGAMSSFALLIAWLSDFFLTPALCSRLR